MAEQSRLRIHGDGEVEVELVTAYLADLEHAYDSILLFESIIEGVRRTSRDFPFPRYQFALTVGWPVARRRGLGHIRDWPPGPEEIASFVPASEQLILSAVQLTQPFEVLRRYLNDRHERRKYGEYREAAEARRLELEAPIYHEYQQVACLGHGLLTFLFHDLDL
jgi:hypothetical protein